MFVPISEKIAETIGPEDDEDEPKGSLRMLHPLCFCRQSRRLVSLSCKAQMAFSSEIAEGFFFEFSFEIAVLSLDGTMESFATQNPRVAAEYLGEIDRAYVRRMVAACYVRLIEEIGPSATIYRVTKMPLSAGAKPMAKHDFLTAALEDAGYRVDEAGTDALGRGFWLMRRRSY